MDPPMSVPTSKLVKPHATAAAAPPELPEDDGARRLQPRHRWRVGGGHVVGQLDCPAGGTDALCLDRIFDGDRQSVQRAGQIAPDGGVVGRGGGRVSPVDVEGDDGVDRPAQPINAAEVAVQQLTARDLFAADRLGQRDRGRGQQLLIHGTSFQPSGAYRSHAGPHPVGSPRR
jgi:hypothetical protein